MRTEKELTESIVLLQSLLERLSFFGGSRDRLALAIAIQCLRDEKAITDELTEPQ